MFERFTRAAREAVVRSQVEARALRHRRIGAEHVFLGALGGPPASDAVAAVGAAGVTADRFRAAVTELADRSEPLGDTDAEALRTLGIDLDEIRRRVEATFGDGAIDQPSWVRRRWPFGRRRSAGCADRAAPPTGHIPFTALAKRVLQRALAEAQARQDRHIGVAHILLGTLDPAGNGAVDALHHLDVNPDDLRAALLTHLDQAA